MFATQSLSDISANTITPTILENYLTQIFLANKHAQKPALKKTYERFGLNTRQIEIIARATPKQNYYFQSPKGSHLFDLNLEPITSPSQSSNVPTTTKTNTTDPRLRSNRREPFGD